MTYKYYKFPTKDYVPTFWPKNVSVSEIGFIPSNKLDYNGNKIIDSSWYVNVSYNEFVDLSTITPYEIQVKTPNRLWFGQQHK
jgi:hypothetical protein